MIAAVALVPNCFSSASQGELFALCRLSQLSSRRPSCVLPSLAGCRQPVLGSASRYRPPCMPGGALQASRTLIVEAVLLGF